MSDRWAIDEELSIAGPATLMRSLPEFSLGRGGHVVVTGGVMALPCFDAAELMTAVANFDSFDEANDPHGERDFGGVDVWGAELLWKIDYYDLELTNASPDAADERVTARVLTVMLAEEY